MPFAVVSSTTLLEVNGKRVRGRLYPWGVVEGRREEREGGREGEAACTPGVLWKVGGREKLGGEGGEGGRR